MKKFRWVLGLLLAVAMLISLAGCGNSDSNSGDGSSATTTTTTATPAEKTKINVAVIKGPTGIGMVQLMKKDEQNQASNDYDFTITAAPDEIVGKLTTGAVDIAAIPTNLAATLYQKTSGKVKLLAVNTKGVLYLLENGNTVNSIADLKGKTIYSIGEGANPEYILRYLLSQNGLDPDKDVKLSFVSENEELIVLLNNGTAQVAQVPEPAVTSAKIKNPDLRVALSINDAWKALNDGSELLMGCVVVRSEFADQNPEAVKAFLEEYKVSIQDANKDVDTTAELCEKYDIIPKAAVAKAAIPNCNLTYMDGEEMKSALKGYLQVLYDADPKSVGGSMPDDNFYYMVE